MFLCLGQLRMPAFKLCTMEFMAAILRGEKKALTNDEVSQICLPKTLYLTKDKLCDQIE